MCYNLTTFAFFQCVTYQYHLRWCFHAFFNHLKKLIYTILLQHMVAKMTYL